MKRALLAFICAIQSYCHTATLERPLQSFTHQLNYLQSQLLPSTNNLFLGVSGFPHQWENYIRKIQNKIRPLIAEASYPQKRYLHMTIKSFDPMPEDKAKKLVHDLSTAAFAPVAMCLDKTELKLWKGHGQTAYYIVLQFYNNQLNHLASEIDKRTPLFIRKLSFIPHVTIAYVHKLVNNVSEHQLQKKLTKIHGEVSAPATCFTARKLQLTESGKQSNRGEFLLHGT